MTCEREECLLFNEGIYNIIGLFIMKLLNGLMDGLKIEIVYDFFFEKVREKG